MATKVNRSIDEVLIEAETKVKASLVEISALITKDFREQAKNVLELYYAHYTKPPRIYERTENLLRGAISDDIEFISGTNVFGGGVQFNSEKMSEYQYGDKDVVVSNFMYGVHGKPYIFVENEPAIQLMKKFQETYKDNKLNGYFSSMGFKVNS